LLWKSIVSNPLLKHTETVLFLNKIDILHGKILSNSRIFDSSTTFCLAKLQAGIQFGHYVISYGNRPNDYENVFLCGYWKHSFYVSKVGLTEAFIDLKKKFGEFLKDRNYNRSPPTLLIIIIAFLHKQHSPSPRLFYCHMTKVTVSD